MKFKALTAQMLRDAADNLHSDDPSDFKGNEYMCHALEDVIMRDGDEYEEDREIYEFHTLLSLHKVSSDGNLRHKKISYAQLPGKQALRFDFLNLLALSEFDE